MWLTTEVRRYLDGSLLSTGSILLFRVEDSVARRVACQGACSCGVAQLIPCTLGRVRHAFVERACIAKFCKHQFFCSSFDILLIPAWDASFRRHGPLVTRLVH